MSRSRYLRCSVLEKSSGGNLASNSAAEAGRHICVLLCEGLILRVDALCLLGGLWFWAHWEIKAFHSVSLACLKDLCPIYCLMIWSNKNTPNEPNSLLAWGSGPPTATSALLSTLHPALRILPTLVAGTASVRTTLKTAPQVPRRTKCMYVCKCMCTDIHINTHTYVYTHMHIHRNIHMWLRI